MCSCVYDLTWQYINAGRSMNAFCTFILLGNVSVDKKPLTNTKHINHFLLLLYWFCNFNLETWCEKCMFYIQIFTAWIIPKHGLPLIRIFPSTILPLYGKIWIWFCSYTEKYGSKQSRILSVYFRLWLRRNGNFLLDWFHDFKA